MFDSEQFQNELSTRSFPQATFLDALNKLWSHLFRLEPAAESPRPNPSRPAHACDPVNQVAPHSLSYTFPQQKEIYYVLSFCFTVQYPDEKARRTN
jgi:hypothetical protein